MKNFLLVATLFATPAVAEPLSPQDAGVGNYYGIEIIGPQEKDPDIASETKIWGRYKFAKGLGGEFSLRPYTNLVLTESGNFLATGGATVTYDRSVAHVISEDKVKISTVNVYTGLGSQALLQGVQESGEISSILGSLSGAVAVVGVEARLSKSTVSFADVRFPVTNFADADFNNPVISVGVGFKF